MNKTAKNSILFSALLSLFLYNACSPFDDSLLQDRFETRTIEKLTWGEESFSHASESTLLHAKKTSIAGANGTVYIGTENNGLWVRKKDEKVFSQITNLGQAPTPGLDNNIGAGNDLKVLALLSSADGVVAVVQSSTNFGVSVIKDKTVYASFAFGQNNFQGWGGCNNPEAVELVKTPSGEAVLVSFSKNTPPQQAGAVIVKNLANDDKAKKAWKPLKSNDNQAFVRPVATEQMGDDVWLLINAPNGFYYYVAQGANIAGGTHTTVQAQNLPIRPNTDSFNFAGQLNQRRALSVGHHKRLFIGLQTVAGQEGKTGGIGVIDSNGQASHVGKGGFVAKAYVRDGNRIMFLTNKGILAHDGTKFEDMIDKAHVNAHQLRHTEKGTAPQNSSGFVGLMPSENIKTGGMADDTLYFLVADAGKEAKVYTLKTEKLAVKVKAAN